MKTILDNYGNYENGRVLRIYVERLILILKIYENGSSTKCTRSSRLVTHTDERNHIRNRSKEEEAVKTAGKREEMIRTMTVPSELFQNNDSNYENVVVS